MSAPGPCDILLLQSARAEVVARAGEWLAAEHPGARVTLLRHADTPLDQVPRAHEVIYPRREPFRAGPLRALFAARLLFDKVVVPLNDPLGAGYARVFRLAGLLGRAVVTVSPYGRVAPAPTAGARLRDLALGCCTAARQVLRMRPPARPGPVSGLTLFAVPKAFTPPIDRLQRNAIGSWRQLGPGVEIILMGDDPGVAAYASAHGLRHVPDLARNERGTPLLSDIFARAEAAASHDVLAYVNADIILTDDFLPALRAGALPRFLMIGQRWDIESAGELDFQLAWRERVRDLVRSGGRLHARSALDYFIFSRGLFGALPPFALGRTAWDNWLIYRASCRGGEVIDASRAITAVHQAHDYNHAPGGAAAVWKGEEARRNQELSDDGIFTAEDADWLLVDGRLVPARTRAHLARRIRSWPARRRGRSMRRPE